MTYITFKRDGNFRHVVVPFGNIASITFDRSLISGYKITINFNSSVKITFIKTSNYVISHRYKAGTIEICNNIIILTGKKK